jgi:hypothetical protein
MHALVIGTMLVARVAASSSSAGLPQGNESPRAADLFRAKRMADEAAARLEVRPPKRGSWARGGSGWERSTAVPDRPKEDRLPSRARVR